MKSILRFIIGKILESRSRYVLRHSGAKVIGITGSVGKTSTKEAIYWILKSKFNVCASQNSFNTPIGLSLSILQEDSGYSSPWAWLKILWHSFLKKPKACDMVILEMGADKPGDIQKLITIAPPKISVVTNVNPVHLDKDQFRDLNDIAEEKSHLVRHLNSSDLAVLNADDPLVSAMQTQAKCMTYGLSEFAKIRASQVRADQTGVHFKVHYKDASQSFSVPILGKFQVNVLLPAITVALHTGLTLSECAKELATFRTPPGRMSLIDGIQDTHLMDGSYNASPITMERSLELLDQLHAPRKIAALGTMNELGERSQEAHLIIGQKAAQVADLLIFVGPEASTLKQGAIEAGMAETSIFTFLDSEEAGHFLEKKLEKRDLILVKGSQNHVRMERLVKCLMKHPEKASELLCRQGEAWQKID